MAAPIGRGSHLAASERRPEPRPRVANRRPMTSLRKDLTVAPDLPISAVPARSGSSARSTSICCRPAIRRARRARTSRDGSRSSQPAAWRTLAPRARNPMPAVHGRVCCHPCESSCNCGQLDSAVSIHAVERAAARVALGANPQQTRLAFREAEAYDGPSLILAYSTCIAHGIDMERGLHQQSRRTRPTFASPRRTSGFRALSRERLEPGEVGATAR